MGGKAFSNLGEHAFPRIPPRIYAALKARLKAQLKTLYACVDTPAEAPEKMDHGDLDFIICEPLTPPRAHADGSIQQSSDAEGDETLAQVKVVLNAQHAILAEGFRTSSFAVSADDELGMGEEGKFYQVDVHVCKDKVEWERILFFHSYGDLGMILGLLARASGFTLGANGLRMHYAQPNDRCISSFPLSESFHEILPFFGLSMDVWVHGFATLADVFAWVQTSHFFVPRRLATAHPAQARKTARQHRVMYNAFLEFLQTLSINEVESETKSVSLSTAGKGEKEIEIEQRKLEPDCTTIRQEALVYFGKKDAYDAIVSENLRRRTIREKLNSTKVMAWTGMKGMVIRSIMLGVRERLSEDDIIVLEEDDLRKIILKVQEELGYVKVGVIQPYEVQSIKAESLSTNPSESA